MKVTYAGKISEKDYSEAYGIIFLSDDPTDPLTRRVEDDLDSFGRYATIRYFISDEQRSIDELDENLIGKVCGDLAADYHDVYSEYTGYLWTDQELNIGGHDIFKELNGSLGRFAHIGIEYSNAVEAVS